MKRSKIIPFVFIQLCICLLTDCQEESAIKKLPSTVLFESFKAQKVGLSRELPGRVLVQRVAEVRPQARGILRERLFLKKAMKWSKVKY